MWTIVSGLNRTTAGFLFPSRSNLRPSLESCKQRCESYYRFEANKGGCAPSPGGGCNSLVVSWQETNLEEEKTAAVVNIHQRKMERNIWDVVSYGCIVCFCFRVNIRRATGFPAPEVFHLSAALRWPAFALTTWVRALTKQPLLFQTGLFEPLFNLELLLSNKTKSEVKFQLHTWQTWQLFKDNIDVGKRCRIAVWCLQGSAENQVSSTGGGPVHSVQLGPAALCSFLQMCSSSLWLIRWFKLAEKRHLLVGSPRWMFEVQMNREKWIQSR